MTRSALLGPLARTARAQVSRPLPGTQGNARRGASMGNVWARRACAASVRVTGGLRVQRNVLGAMPEWASARGTDGVTLCQVSVIVCLGIRERTVGWPRAACLVHIIAQGMECVAGRAQALVCVRLGGGGPCVKRACVRVLRMGRVCTRASWCAFAKTGGVGRRAISRCSARLPNDA